MTKLSEWIKFRMFTTILKTVIPLSVLLMCAGCNPYVEGKQAINGVMDLTDYDPRTDGLVELKGEWLIYWDQFLLPGDPAINPPIPIPVPRRWNHLPWQGGGLPDYGKATYQLTVKFNPQLFDQPGEALALALKIKDIHSAYRVYINGKHYFDKGVALEKPLYKPVLGHEAVFFETDTPVVVITIQVANYSDLRQAGMDENMILGSAQRIKEYILANQYIYTLSFGILFILFFYHLLLYLFRRKDKINLYFSILCLLLSVQSAFMGQKAIYYIFPNLSADLYIRIFMTSLLVIAFAFLYYGKLLPKEFPAGLVKGVTWFYGIMSVYFLVQPFNIIFIGDAYFVVTGIFLLYALAALISAVIKRKPHALVILIGASFAILAGINDLLHGLEVIYTGYYAPVGFIFYTFSQSILISFHFTQSFKQTEKLSTELEQLNLSLEGLVKERTRDLDEVNENLIRLNATKDRFFSIIAHDLKGPIGAVTSLLEIVVSQAEDFTEEKRKEFLQQIYLSTDNTYKLLENLLTWARSQQDEITYEPGAVKLTDIVKQVETLLLESARKKGISLTSKIAADYRVYCDANMIQTVLRNLVNNAIKFTGRGGNITLGISPDGENKVRVSVTDTGTGMPESLVGKLFKIEEKVASTKGTGGETGTGLGLIISNDFLIKHDSRLQVTSALNEGSTFFFSLTRIPE